MAEIPGDCKFEMFVQKKRTGEATFTDYSVPRYNPKFAVRDNAIVRCRFLYNDEPPIEGVYRVEMLDDDGTATLHRMPADTPLTTLKILVVDLSS